MTVTHTIGTVPLSTKWLKAKPQLVSTRMSNGDKGQFGIVFDNPKT